MKSLAAVVCAGESLQRDLDAGLREKTSQLHTLRVRHERVAITVQNQERWAILADVMHRAPAHRYNELAP
jgi:hypothetical protein